MAELGDAGMVSRNHPGSDAVHPGAGKRLNSWKEIAEYIGRDARTAQRWESNGLPVHRLMHDKGATVYALSAEIDEWIARRSASPQIATPPESPPVQPGRTHWSLWA